MNRYGSFLQGAILTMILSAATLQLGLGQESNQAPPAPLEARIAAHFQPIYNQNKQRIFLLFHPGGTATAITVNDVKITQWVSGQPTGQITDVQQFIVHYTIYWSSFIHHGDGVTELNTVYSVTPGHLQAAGSQIVKTNGITKSTVNKDAGAILGKLALHL